MTIVIARCIKSEGVSQTFGEAKAVVKLGPNGTVVRPFVVATKINGIVPDGWADFYKIVLGMLGHNGIDRPCWFKEYVYFDTMADCRWFAKTESDKDGGIGVDVMSDRPVKQCTEPGCNQIHYIKRRYWHLWEPLVYDGEEIFVGRLVGRADSTGASSGNHVHDATKWCDEKGNGIHLDNGYQGAFDDTSMRMNIFIVDHLSKPFVHSPIEAEVYRIRLTILDLMRKLLFQMSQSLKGR